MSHYIIQLSDIITKVSNIATAEIDGELVMMNLNSNAYYGLDDIGSEIWGLLETPLTVSQLCQTLADMFDVGEKTLQEDVRSFLSSLLKEKMIELK